MKTILSSTLVIFLLSQVLTSCNSSMNIAKRHYNPGYYVSFKSGNKKTEEKKSVSKTPITASEQLINQEKTPTETAINNADEFPLTASISKTQPIAHINHNKLKENNSSKKENTFPIVTEIKKLKQEHNTFLNKLKSKPTGGGDPSKNWAVIVGIIFLLFFFPLAMPFFRIGFDSELSAIAKVGWWIALALCILTALAFILFFAFAAALL